MQSIDAQTVAPVVSCFMAPGCVLDAGADQAAGLGLMEGDEYDHQAGLF